MRRLPTVLLLLAVAGPARSDTGQELLRRVNEALRQGHAEEALRLAGEAVQKDPRSARAHYAHGLAQEVLRRPDKALGDFSRSLELDPTLDDALDHRGSAAFLTGRIADSARDFDRYVERRPEELPGHWRRGITLYYAGRFEEGARQFAAYEKVDTNDVENAVWHYLCNARAVGPAQARTKMLKIGKDRRVPMTEVYEMFLGRKTPADVLAAAEAGTVSKDERRQRLNFAHLYLGLYYESQGDPARSLEHMTRAAGDYAMPNYMGDVARVHRDLRRKEAPAKP